MLSLLPDYADPRRLCALGKAFEGTVPLAQLTRLTPLLTSTEGEAAFALRFESDTGKRPIVEVQVRAQLTVECQRCLGNLALTVESTSRLSPVEGPDEAARLPDSLDPLLVAEGRLALRSLIEDELILAVPAAPAHDPDRCPVKLDTVNASPDGSVAVGAREQNAFAALASLTGDATQED